MLTLPLPLIVALILGFLAVRHMLARDRSALFLSLLWACAIQSLIISLARHYGVAWLIPLQPVTAMIAPALAWLSFQTAALRPASLSQDWVHVAGPVFVAFSVIFAPQVIDVVLPAIFAAYGVAMLFVLRKQDTMPGARLASGPVPARLWSAMAAMLLLSALSDMLIAIAFSLGYGELREIILSIFASVTLLSIGLLSLSPDVEADIETKESLPEVALEEEIKLIARLDDHMRQARPYLDPDLTLSRLARQLHVPIKHLSAAINRHKGQNVSRYVNGFRIAQARTLLQDGATVTEAMLASGFNTKSNFNREFLRVAKQSPSDFLASQKA